MELIKYPNPILSQKCADVKIGDSKILDMLNAMSKKLYEWEGAGLAAPQVGVLKRAIVIDVRSEPQCLYKLINPRIIWKSEEMIESKEGCLSLPTLRDTVWRHESITVEYLDENFKKQEINAMEFLSCCLQHELDHLDGVLYIDRLSRLKRSLAIKRFNKSQEKENLEYEGNNAK
jgi:peptide deformylase